MILDGKNFIVSFIGPEIQIFPEIGQRTVYLQQKMKEMLLIC